MFIAFLVLAYRVFFFFLLLFLNFQQEGSLVAACGV